MPVSNLVIVIMRATKKPKKKKKQIENKIKNCAVSVIT